MSGFGVHLRVGVGYGTAAAIAVCFLTVKAGIGILHATGLGTAAFVLGVGTAILPDVDTPASIPRRLYGKGGFFAVGAVALGAVVLNPSLLDPLVGLLLSFVPDPPSARAIGGALVVGGALVGATMFGLVFDNITKHRGIWHHPLFGVALGLVTAIMIFQSGAADLLLSGGLGLVVAGGFFAHIVTDWLS